jgi:hyperosmotically inducible periplasmic protein
MNSKNTILALLPAMVLGIGLAIPALAEDASTNPPVSASTSMDRAGRDTEGAAKNAYIGTATAVEDTKITTEVKTAFARGKSIKSGAIHVSTTAGIVTLQGQVQNSRMAARAEAIARNTQGVRGVTNDLRVSSLSSQN